MTYYKVLDRRGRCYFGGKGRWPLPSRGRSGRWLPPVRGDLVACANGYHLVTLQQIHYWYGPEIWVAEGRGDSLACEDKYVWRQARLLARTGWNARTAREYACDCAEHVLPRFEDACPQDDRPRRAIEVARRYARGQATDDEQVDAWKAAWSAAEEARTIGAAWAAATAAAWVTGEPAWAAARDASWSAVAAAAWATQEFATLAATRKTVRVAVRAAGTAAGSAERRWQTRRLAFYLRGAWSP